MRLTTKHIALCAAALLGFASHAAAQQQLSWAQQMFDTLDHNFGVVARGAVVTHRIKVTNKYNAQVHIASVTTSCGCAAAKPGKETLAPNETTYVEVTMNTIRFEHQKDSNVIVVFDAPQYAEVRVPVHAYIRTDVVLVPGGAEFGAVAAGAEQQKKINVQYAGRENWTIKDVVCRNPNLDVKVTQTARSAGRVNYDLVVTMKSGTPVGELRDQLTLVTDDASNPYIPVLVEARVEAEYSISPDVVSFGMMTPGEKKTMNVVVRGKKPFAIEKIESEKSAGMFEVRLPAEPRVLHVLPLTLIAPTTPGTVEEMFTMTIGGLSEPVSFKAYGQVVQPTQAPAAN